MEDVNLDCGARSQVRPTSGRLSTILVLLGAAIALVATGCSSPEDSATTTTDVTVDIGADCSAEVDAQQVSPLCEETLYLGSVDAGDYPELAEIDPAQLVGFARGLCAYASALSGYSDEQLPTYGDLITSSSNSWGVEPEVVDSVTRSTKVMCPEGNATLSRLRKSNDDGITVELLVSGSGDASVEYTLPDGSARTNEVTTPWSQVLHLTQAATISLSVNPVGDAEVGCQISVNGEVVAAERVAAEAALCDITEEALNRTLSDKVVNGD